MQPDLIPFAGSEHQPFEMGEGNSGVLMIHGFAGTPAELHNLGEAFADRGWYARGMLLPGFGTDIVNLDKYRQTDWLEAAREELTQLRNNHNPVAVLGFSMGGAVALQLALSEVVDKLVLISPFWHVQGWMAKLVPLARLLKIQMRPFKNVDFNDPMIRVQLDRIIPNLDIDDPPIQDYIRTQFTFPLNAINQILYMGKSAYIGAESLSTSTLVIQGTEDQAVQPSATRKLVERIPPGSVEYREIHAGHDLLTNGYNLQVKINQMVLEFVEDAQ